jgi:hypothetical protein
VLDAARAVRDVPLGRRARALRDAASPERVRLALAQDDLRRRAAAKCPHADVLLFVREALEQATAWPVAEERAGRWPKPAEIPLTDLTAGIGLDALATARTGRAVVAYERDPVRAALLRHNAEALGVADRLEVREEDVVAAAPHGPLALLDPGRREGDWRTRDPSAFQPPAARWEDLLARFGAAMVKLPPATAGSSALGEPFEVVSLGGRARERRRFLGAWPDLPARRALCLPGGQAVAGAGAAWPDAVAPREGDWLLDPDPAVTLAGLVGDLARERGLRPMHPRIAYLLGSERTAGAPGHWVRIAAVLPARPKAIDAWLASNDVGRIEIRTRGVADRASAWRRRLHPRGRGAATLVFTRSLADRWTVLAGRVTAE